jgi:DNA-binding MarR family transcriptional regulator
MDLSRYLGYLIRRAAQVHVAVWSREVSTETTSVQFGVLASLSDSDGMSQRELGDALDLDRSTIADLVARLERRGLVSRRRQERDSRANLVNLTPAGRDEYAELAPRVAEVDRILAARLSGEERERLASLLTAVLAGTPE